MMSSLEKYLEGEPLTGEEISRLCECQFCPEIWPVLCVQICLKKTIGWPKLDGCLSDRICFRFSSAGESSRSKGTESQKKERRG